MEKVEGMSRQELEAEVARILSGWSWKMEGQLVWEKKKSASSAQGATKLRRYDPTS